jgi:hypothetical protein
MTRSAWARRMDNGPSAVFSSHTSATRAVPWPPPLPASGSKSPGSVHQPLPDPPTTATPAENAFWPKTLSPELCQTRQSRRLFSKSPRKAPRPKLWVCAGGSGGCDVARSGRATPRLGAAPGTVCLGRGASSVPICSRATALIFNCPCVLLRCIVCFSLASSSQEPQPSAPGLTMAVL